MIIRHLKLTTLFGAVLVCSQFANAQSVNNSNNRNNNKSNANTPNVIIDTSTSEATSTVSTDPNRRITPADDAKINTSVKAEITKVRALSNLPINITTKEGVVYFSGNVDSDSQASSLVELAQQIIGVKDVETPDLKVKESAQPVEDMMTTAKIKGLFIREKVFGGKDIAAINLSVETKNGVVYLTGVVDNPEQLENAKKIIAEVKGVKRVEYIVKKVTVTQPTNHGMDNNKHKMNGNHMNKNQMKNNEMNNNQTNKNETKY